MAAPEVIPPGIADRNEAQGDVISFDASVHFQAGTSYATAALVQSKGTDGASLTAGGITLDSAAVSGNRLGLYMIIRGGNAVTTTVTWGGSTATPDLSTNNGADAILYFERAATADANDAMTFTISAGRNMCAFMFEIENSEAPLAVADGGWANATSHASGTKAPTVPAALSCCLLALEEQQQWTTDSNFAGVTVDSGYTIVAWQHTRSANRPAIALATKSVTTTDNTSTTFFTSGITGNVHAINVVFEGSVV